MAMSTIQLVLGTIRFGFTVEWFRERRVVWWLCEEKIFVAAAQFVAN